MSGEEFKKIRRSNRITQASLASLFGYSHYTSVSEIETLPAIPAVFVKTFSRVINRNLDNPEILKQTLDEADLILNRRKKRPDKYMSSPFYVPPPKF